MLLVPFIILTFLLFLPKLDKKYIIILTVLILSLITITSFGFGTDYLSYEYIYNNINFNTYYAAEDMEPGFQLLLYLSHYFNLDYHIFATTLRLSILLSTLIWIYDSSSNIPVSILVFFSMFYIVWIMSAYRQGIVLSILLNVFFNKRRNFNNLTKILSIILMSFIHISSWFFVIFILTDYLELNKKKHMIIFTLSLLSTLIPYKVIFKYLPTILLENKFASYLHDSFGFFDISSFMRLFFFLFGMLFYDQLSNKSSYWKKIIDSFLVGMSIYFVLGFSEIIAGRFTIYSLVLIVILLPEIVEVIGDSRWKPAKISIIDNKKMVNIIVTLLIIVLSLGMFTKEYYAYVDQVGYKENNQPFSYELIFNKNYDNFDNIYAYRLGQAVKAKELASEFQSNINNIKVEPYNKENVYLSVYDRSIGKYRIISNQGDILDYEPMNENYSILSNIIVKSKRENVVTNRELLDLSNSGDNFEELAKKISNHRIRDYTYQFNETVIENVEINDILENPSDFVPYPENISDVHLTKIDSEDFTYHVMMFKYYHYTLYIYFDAELKPYTNLVHTSLREFTWDGLLYATTYGGTIIYNTDGEIIWFN